MLKLALVLALISGTNALAGDTYVRGYQRSNGTYVQGYHRTTPDETVNNNYGTQGNLNPYTGQSGHKQRNPSQGLGTYNPGNGMGTLGTGNSADGE
jgi:hypothetical protein